MTPLETGVPSHFLVIVPGYMGSTLRNRRTGKLVWIDFGSIPRNPLQWDDWLDHFLAELRYPNDELEPVGLVEEVIFALPWAKQEHYGRLYDALEAIGYKADPDRYAEDERDVYAFPYDWRQDNRLSARELGKAVDRWRTYHPDAEVWILAHSNGGLVARWYIEQGGGKKHVTRLLLMGSPWDGTPVAMRVLVRGFDYLLRRGFNPFGVSERSRDVIRSFPSIYQLVPTQRSFVRARSGRALNPFSDFEWLETRKHKQLLLAGRRFSQMLGDTLSVETLCFFGRKRSTTNSAVVLFDDDETVRRMDWYARETGDGTIPEYSAVHPRASQKLPFAAGHGDIYAVDPVLEFLQWELRDKYEPGVRALLERPTFNVLFEPDRDVYAPGEPIAVTATVLGPEDDAGRRQPFTSAKVKVELLWKQSLPGDDASPTDRRAGEARLQAGRAAGTYRAQLPAPDLEGYYDLRAMVGVPGQPSVELMEAISIEAEIDST